MNMDTNPQEPQKESMGNRILKELWDLVKIFVVCFVVVYGVTNFIAKPIRVEGSSMYPTLQDKEIGVTNVIGVKLGSITRFDVVIIHNDEVDEHWVKRVIALPGETIECKDDVIYINGTAIEQPFLDSDYVTDWKKSEVFTADFGPIVLGADEYFLMGDNRPRSEDSRVHGPFKRSEIIGKDALVIFPFNEIKVVRNPEA